jgi:hypothetical protein
MERTGGQLDVQDDRVYYFTSNSDGFDYLLGIHKFGSIVMFGKNRIELETITTHDIAANKAAGLYVCTKHGEIEKKIFLPAQFVHAKYYQTKCFFNRIESVQKKLCEGTLATEDPELASQIDLNVMRAVNQLLEDLADDKHLAETIESKLNLTIHNATGNGVLIAGAERQFDLRKADDDEWLSVRFNSGSYYLEPKTIHDEDTLYYLAVSMKRDCVIFAKKQHSEFKVTTHNLYISQDDGLGRYRIQKGDDVITQFFVPTDFISYTHNRSKQFIDEVKKVNDTISPDVYLRQAMWNKLHDDVIHLIDSTLTYTEKDLKRRIDESLHHSTAIIPMSNVINFDDFYNEVLDVGNATSNYYTDSSTQTLHVQHV